MKTTTNITCRFCGVKTGEYTREPWMNEVQLADVRCAPCELAEGKYKDMERFYEQELNKTPQEYEDFAKLKPTFNDVLTVAAKERPGVLFLKNHINPLINSFVEDLEVKLNLKKKNTIEKVRLTKEHYKNVV